MDTSASDILARLTMEKINNNVIWGREERGEPDPRTYDEQLSAARQKALDCIKTAVDAPGADARDAAAQEIQALLDTAKDVYTAVGMKVGAELSAQTLRHERQKKGREAPGLPTEPDDSAEDYCPYPSEEEFSILHSKDFMERMAARVNLQTLGAYIRDGGTRRRLYEKPFSERIEEADHELDKQVKALTRDKENADKMHDAISGYEMAISDVYFSLGMKTGARLDALLMGRFDRDY